MGISEYEKSLIERLKIENDILYNDITVMRAVIKSILDLKPVSIDSIDYFKVADIACICQQGFKSLSNEVQKEAENNGQH